MDYKYREMYIYGLFKSLQFYMILTLCNKHCIMHTLNLQDFMSNKQTNKKTQHIVPVFSNLHLLLSDNSRKNSRDIQRERTTQNISFSSPIAAQQSKMTSVWCTGCKELVYKNSSFSSSYKKQQQRQMYSAH